MQLPTHRPDVLTAHVHAALLEQAREIADGGLFDLADVAECASIQPCEVLDEVYDLDSIEGDIADLRADLIHEFDVLWRAEVARQLADAPAAMAA